MRIWDLLGKPQKYLKFERRIWRDVKLITQNNSTMAEENMYCQFKKHPLTSFFYIFQINV